MVQRLRGFNFGRWVFNDGRSTMDGHGPRFEVFSAQRNLDRKVFCGSSTDWVGVVHLCSLSLEVTWGRSFLQMSQT